MDKYGSSTFFNSGKSVYSEIKWGSKFRKRRKEKQQKSNEKQCPDKKPKCEIPNPCKKLDALFAALNAEGKKQYADPFEVIRREEMLDTLKRKHKCNNNRDCKCNKTKIINRDLLTRRQHIELLAKPRVNPQDVKKCPTKKTKTEKDCKKMAFADLSPRLKQLALPSKRLVYANWAEYQDILDADTVVRMENILVAEKGKNLDGDEVKKYFKCKDKKRRKCKVSKKQKVKDKKYKKWLTNEVNILVDLIVHSFAKKPLHAESNRHIQLTNSMIATLRFKGFKVKPISRKTKNFRKRTVLGIFDHISVWADKVFQEAERLDSEISVRRYEKLLQRYKDEEEAAEAAKVAREAARKAAKKAVREASEKKKRRSSLDVFDDLSYKEDREIIDTLIKLLESGSAKDLDRVIHNELLSDVTYRQLLDKLRSMRDGGSNMDLQEEAVQPLKQELLNWTRKTRSQQLSKEVTEAIEAVSKCMLKMFDVKPSSSKAKGVKTKNKSKDVLKIPLAAADDVDLSAIPKYKDQNEYLEEELLIEGLTDDENAFDQSMYVGHVEEAY